MIKELGWDALASRSTDRELAACRREGACRCSRSIRRRAKRRPTWTRREAPSPTRRSRRACRRRRRAAPASRRRSCRCYQAGDEAYARWRATNVRPQKQFGYVIVDRDRAARRPDERADARARRARARLRRRHRARDHGSGSGVPLGAASATSASSTAGWRRPASAWPKRRRSPTSTSCPGAESCRLAVTQSRGLGRLLEEHLRARPDLIAAADGARIKISGCPNGCGQHHIATIGFQGSVRRARRAAPCRSTSSWSAAARPSDGASFARLAAKIPARRIPEVVERLIALYAARAQPTARSAPAFFAARRPARGHARAAAICRG